MKKVLVLIITVTILIGFTACNRDGCGCYKPVIKTEKRVQNQLFVDSYQSQLGHQNHQTNWSNWSNKKPQGSIDDNLVAFLTTKKAPY